MGDWLSKRERRYSTKLDEVDEATLNTIVQSTQELDAVGGDITKVSPETRKAIQDLTSTNGGRWRFEYQTNGIVNQYLDYVGLKDNQLFQNMSDGEKKRLFDIPNQMNNLDELPANAKKKKIEAKAQEKMIEQQAASYAIQQNPQDAAEFVNHTEFYKTQIEQKIVGLEKQYEKKLEDAVINLAVREGIEPNFNTLTPKQKVAVNRHASQEFFQELYGETKPLDGEKAIEKHIRKKTYENAGTGDNFEQLKPQIRDEIQDAYSAKAAEVGDNIGGIQIKSF